MNKPSNKNWPKDEFAWHEVAQFWWWILFIAVVLLAAWLLPALARAKRTAQGNSASTVVVYCAQDQTYAEPLLRQFETETGIRVKTVYDSEAVKTVGLANRLLAERGHPQADVFWGNEEMRTRQLAALGVWRETNGFSSFGARRRCLVLHTNSLADGMRPLPRSLLELTNETWRGRVAMAFPQFGTTATHFHVLRQHWGKPLWRAWGRGLVANDTRMLDGNSTVVKLVGRGEAWIGLTDTDDVLAGQRDGLPVVQGPDLPETLLFIPNTVGIVRGAPHPAPAQALADYLHRPATLQQLLAAGAIQYAGVPSTNGPTLQPDWDRVLADLPSTTEELNRLFLR